MNDRLIFGGGGVTSKREADLEERIRILEHINSANEGQLLDVVRKLDALRETKAWSIMLFARRARMEFFKGKATERLRFVRGVISRMLFGSRVNLYLNQYEPFVKITIAESLEHKSMALIPFDNLGEEIDDSISHVIDSLNDSRISYPIGLDIFRFAVIEWDFRWQRPQQFSVQFADHDHRVFYISIDTINIENPDLDYEYIKKNVQIRLLRQNVWSIRLCSRKELNAYRSTIDDAVDLRYLQWSIQAVREYFGCGMTVSIVDLPFWTPLVLSLDSTNKVVYDCMDDHSGFSTNSSEMLVEEQVLETQADLVIASSARLYEKIYSKNANILLLRNAGEYSHFEARPKEDLSELSRLTGKVVGYYGAISEWFDVDLVYKLAAHNVQWTFVLVGNTFGCETEKLEKLKNVLMIGEISYDKLPAYLHRFDVCLIPFKVYNLTLATNPVKIYEYMSAGKPVVSTRLPEVELMSDYVYIADDFVGFQKAIEKALSENREILVPVRKEFARSNTWGARYELLSETLLNRFFPLVSIIVVTYGNWPMTRHCVQSLIRQSAYPNLEIILVDNGSAADMRQGLAGFVDPRIRVILLPKNTGFAIGNSEGLRASTGKYIILLNNDTIVPNNWVYRLIRAFNVNEKLGMVGPVSNSVGNDQMLDYVQSSALYGADEPWLEEFYRLYRDRLRITDYLGFFCVAIKREVYEKVGDLDANFGIGMFEDDDYCERVRIAGYELGVVEDAFVYHLGSASFKGMELEERDNIWIQNRNYFEQKWGKSWETPNPPDSFFYGAVDRSMIAASMKRSPKSTIGVFGALEWNSVWESWQELSVTLSEPYLVIVSVISHLGKDIEGTRKVGPDLYLTNVIGLFDRCIFDHVILCGGVPDDNLIRFNDIFLIRACYKDAVFQNLQSRFPQAKVYEDETQVLEALIDLKSSEDLG